LHQHALRRRAHAAARGQKEGPRADGEQVVLMTSRPGRKTSVKNPLPAKRAMSRTPHLPNDGRPRVCPPSKHTKAKERVGLTARRTRRLAASCRVLKRRQRHRTRPDTHALKKEGRATRLAGRDRCVGAFQPRRMCKDKGQRGDDERQKTQETTRKGRRRPTRGTGGSNDTSGPPSRRPRRTRVCVCVRPPMKRA
jgi:hypothetical protein